VNIIFPEEREQQKLNEVFDEVLGERKVSIFIRNFILREEDEKKQLKSLLLSLDEALKKTIYNSANKIHSLALQLDIAKEGLKAIEESGETNIARKTLDELNKKKDDFIKSSKD